MTRPGRPSRRWTPCRRGCCRIRPDCLSLTRHYPGHDLPDPHAWGAALSLALLAACLLVVPALLVALPQAGAWASVLPCVACALGLLCVVGRDGRGTDCWGSWPGAGPWGSLLGHVPTAYRAHTPGQTTPQAATGRAHSPRTACPLPATPHHSGHPLARLAVRQGVQDTQPQTPHTPTTAPTHTTHPTHVPATLPGHCPAAARP